MKISQTMKTHSYIRCSPHKNTGHAFRALLSSGRQLLALVFLISGLATYAQDECGERGIEQAEKNYAIGNFGETILQLENCLSSGGFDREQKTDAYRILAGTYLATDSMKKAEEAMTGLLELSPNFQVRSDDPLLFRNMVEKVKAGSTMMAITTSVSKKAENVYEAPATVIVITNEQIRRRGYTDLEALLHDLPGFDISRSNGILYSHIYQRGYRSNNTNRTLLLVDGVEENGLWGNIAYLSRQYPISNIKNVEVIYGPASTMYGANAFAGVISINTKQPEGLIPQDKDFGINVEGGYGSWNTSYIDATVAGRLKNRHISFMATGRLFRSDEMDLSGFPEHDFKTRSLDNELTATYQSNLNITGQDENGTYNAALFLRENGGGPNENFYTPTIENGDTTAIQVSSAGMARALELDNQVLANTSFSDLTEAVATHIKLKVYDFTLGWHYWWKAEGLGSWYNDIQQAGANEGQSWNPTSNFFYLKYDKVINKQLSLTSFTRYKVHGYDKNNLLVRLRGYSNGRLGLTDLIQDSPSRWDSLYLTVVSNQIRTELRLLYTPNERLNIISGIEARFSALQGDYITTSAVNNPEENGEPADIPGGNHFFSRDLGLYSQATYQLLPKLKTTLGLRYDFNRIRKTGGYGQTINPRVALVYLPGDYIFKAIYSEAFKDATSWDRYSTVSGQRELSNPDLEPEKVQNIELSARRFFGKKISVEAVAYYAFYSQAIVSEQVSLADGSTTSQFQSKGKREVFGIQMMGEYTHRNWNLYANYTFTSPHSVGDSLDDGKGNTVKRLRIGDIADHQINLGVNYRYRKNLNLNLRMNYVSERSTGPGTSVTTNSTPNVFEAYAILNGTVSYHIKNTGIRLYLTVNNILDKEYFSPGLRGADGQRFSSKLPQNERNIHLKVRFSM